MKATLQSLFKRDLEKLKTEIEQYSTEANLWRTDKSITNSAGNLCLHLIGNLKAFIGAGMAKTDYIRDREFEFAGKDVPKSTLLQQIDETMVVVEKGLDTLTDETLSGDFPIQIWGKPTGMEFTVIHLLSHLNYHLGQINYHRRLLDN
ncbi:DUF1572 family protein [Flagellimonas beolgyonensis]|uniref:DUF1572 family protein n=1 Tax=Flagellimonas beolgyonensis TaxID=864064 RepID=UPI003D65320C